MIRLLVKHRENLNPSLCGSPISNLLMLGKATDREMIDLLLQNGADINHREYFSGDMPITTAFALAKGDYVNYFLDRGADPMALDYNGNSLALLVQREVADGRGTEQWQKEYQKIRDRLVSQYHITFPVKWEIRKGIEERVQRYEKLSQKDKDLLGKDGLEGVQLDKTHLETGRLLNGASIDSIEEASMKAPTK